MWAIFQAVTAGCGAPCRGCRLTATSRANAKAEAERMSLQVDQAERVCQPSAAGSEDAAGLAKAGRRLRKLQTWPRCSIRPAAQVMLQGLLRMSRGAVRRTVSRVKRQNIL